MHFSFATVAAAALAFATLGNSHLMIKTPVPFGQDTLNNSPLNDVAPGVGNSDYPCKQRPGVYKITQMNNMAAGEPQELSFDGSASHGGGTCQIAVTLDKEPTINSQFKLIQVFEGGCPADSEGNTMPHPFTYTIPKDFPNGVATLAWVWYNRIGNREIYMNCAPITVTGGSDSKDYYNSLPNLYLINLPTTECQDSFESESNAVTVPHPGQFILTDTNGQDMHAAVGPNCSAKAAAQLDGVVGYKSNVVTNNGASYKWTGSSGTDSAPAPDTGSFGSASGSASSSASSTASSASSAATSAASGSAMAGGSQSASAASSPAASVSSSSASSMAAGSSGAATASSAPTSSAAASGSSFPQLTPSSGAGMAGPTGAAPSGASPTGGSSSGGATTGGSCTSGSGMACSTDGKKFGLCANGQMVWQAVAPGTSCKNGQIVKRSDFRNPHVRRHAQHAARHGA